MMIALAACYAITASAPEIEFVRMQSAIGSFRRLAAAIPAAMPNDLRLGKRSHKARKAGLDSLLVHLGKVQEAMATGKLASGTWSENCAITINVLMFLVVDAGKMLAAFPEEALCWDRAGLDFISAHRRFVALKVNARKLPQPLLDQISATHEMFLRDYQETLAKCIPNRN